MSRTIKANQFIDITLDNLMEALGKHLDSEVLFLKSPIYMGLDNVIRATVEEIVRRKGTKVKKALTVVLETEGGYIEVVERICNVFRRHFREVYFIVPNYAYSAGTVLVLSGDKIYMDYYSVLGPIDPQLQNAEGKFIPGMGYLYKYNELLEKSADGTITDAELLFLTKRFDPAELFSIEQAKNHSRDLIKEWLVIYKFKDWSKTQTRGKKITKKDKEERAEQIADILANAERWHSHGRGINKETLESDEINLKVDDIEDDDELSKIVRQYYDLFVDYAGKLGYRSVIHSCAGLIEI